MADGDSEDEAARAFDDLRGEITLLRRAVERLTAERAEDGRALDYSETLGVISQNLSVTAQRVDALVKSPALSLTPEEIGRQIVAAAYEARREDHRLFAAARQGMEEVARKIGRQLHSHTEAGGQRRRLWQAGFAGLAAGMVLWAIFAGPIARAMPASWLLPERMAARALRMPMWESGQRMMQSANPTQFRAIVAGDRIVTVNREALEACRKRANKVHEAARCTVNVDPTMERDEPAHHMPETVSRSRHVYVPA